PRRCRRSRALSTPVRTRQAASNPPCPDGRARPSLPAAYPRPRAWKRTWSRRSGRELAVEDAASDVVHLDPIVHCLLLEEAPCLLLGRAVLVHEDALGAVDRLALLESLGQVPDVPFQRRQLGISPERHLDGGNQVALLERLDQIRERTRVTRLFDEIA